MLLSNKALLAVLWELYPGASAAAAGVSGWAARTGHHQRVCGEAAAGEGGGGGVGAWVGDAGRSVPDGPLCCQELASLPDFDGNRVVLGAWVVEGESAGSGYGSRES
ncbi:glutathionylspermidine synthase family protein [Streptomyces sp. NPDC004610]|uniref:glutathionylspermidine synthase family protein n=1 Tax=unclassified Streptomyces TaxID=2593676 RepID=UPI00339EC1D3